MGAAPKEIAWLLEIIEARGLRIVRKPDGSPCLRGPKSECTKALTESLKVYRAEVMPFAVDDDPESSPEPPPEPPPESQYTLRSDEPARKKAAGPALAPQPQHPQADYDYAGPEEDEDPDWFPPDDSLVDAREWQDRLLKNMRDHSEWERSQGRIRP